MDETLLVKILSALGVPGMVTYFGYRLADKYLGKYVEVATRQAAAIEQVAVSMKEQRDDQRDVLIALRVVSGKVEEVLGRQKEISEQLAPGSSRGSAAA